MGSVTDNNRVGAHTFENRNNEGVTASKRLGDELRIETPPRVALVQAVTAEDRDDEWKRRERDLDRKRQPRVAEMLALLSEAEVERLRELAEAERDGDERRAKFLRMCAPSSRLTAEQRAVRQMQRLAGKHAGWCARCGKDLAPGEKVVVQQAEPWGMAPRCVDCAGSHERWQSPDRKGDCGGCGRPVVLRNPWAWHRKHIYCCTRCADVIFRKLRQRNPKPVACDGCDAKFTPSRADARFCSNACRQRDYRTRKAAR